MTEHMRLKALSCRAISKEARLRFGFKAAGKRNEQGLKHLLFQVKTTTKNILIYTIDCTYDICVCQASVSARNKSEQNVAD